MDLWTTNLKLKVRRSSLLAEQNHGMIYREVAKVAKERRGC